jgi:putative sigma-54 modulation protein
VDGKVDIVTRNLELTDRIKEYVNKKAVKLDRFINGIDETRVDLAYSKSARSASDRQVAQITLRGKGFILRTEERADDLFTAFDAALDKMQRQIERYKGKHFHGRGDGSSISEVTQEPAEAVTPEPGEHVAVIARRKQFRLIPMDENEAIEQMSLLGHDNFFVFFNANTQKVNVLYTRRDGTFGLIEPEIG